jgi:hypothetical protein
MRVEWECPPVHIRSRMTTSPSRCAGSAVHLPVDGFAWTELSREAELQGVEPSELASHAIAYYLADLDRGRIARRIPRPEEPSS